MSIKVNGIESYVGQVVHTEWIEERIMSDVWDFVLHATVLKPDGTYETISGIYQMEATVDASPEQVEAYHAKCVADAKAKELKERKQSAMNYLMFPATGKTVEVVAGRKVAKGTRGTLFWKKETPYGVKVGIALDNIRDASGKYLHVAWTYLRNIEVVPDPAEVAAIEAMA